MSTRLEATVPESRAAAAFDLANELGLSRSQFVDEAIMLFVKAVVETRRGRRLVFVEPGGNQPVCELSTPTLTMLELAGRPAKLDVSAEELTKLNDLNEAPPKPTERLRKAARRHVGR
jgi:hypothetical protein